MRLKEYIALFFALVFMLSGNLWGQALTVSVELNNPSNILADWEKKANSMRVNISNKTNKLLLATFYIEISNNDGAIANNSGISGEFIELKPGNNRFLANKLLPAFGINYIRGLPNVPLEGGNYEICVNVDISGNAVEGDVVFKGCNQWEAEQSTVSVTEPKVFSGGALRSPQDSLVITRVRERAVRFSWNAISPRPELPVTYMLLVYAKEGNLTNQEIISDQAPILELPVVGKYNVVWPSSQPLLGNGEYIWTVRPVNSVGEALLPPPGINETRTFTIDCDIKKLLPKTNDGLFALDLPIPSGFSLLANPSQNNICWDALPLEDLSYQLNYTKAICDSIISDDSPYPFAPFIPSSVDEELINQVTQEEDELNAELKLWNNFASKHVQRFVWAEQELEMWENIDRSLYQLSKGWLNMADTLDMTLSCEKNEICCGDNDCCKGLNPCFKSERELFLSRLICQEEQLDRLRHQQVGELIGLLGTFTRQHLTLGAQQSPEVYGAYFQIYSSLIELLSYFESKNSKQHRAFSEVVSKYTDLQQQAPSIYQKLVSTQTAYWQVLSRSLKEAEAKKKLLPSSLLVSLEEYLIHISPESSEVMGKTRSGVPKDVKDYLQNAFSINRCLTAFSSRKKEHLEACQNFSIQVSDCLEDEKRKLVEKKNNLINASVQLRSAYWESVSDSIQTVFQEAVKTLGTKWRKDICEVGGKISLPGAQTESAIALRNILQQKLGQKVCYLNFTVSADCVNPENEVTLTHSYPLLRRNENCCNSETELSWQSKKIEGQEEICFSVSTGEIVETFNQQLAILNPQTPKLKGGDVYAGRWSLTAFDSTGVMQGYSPSKVFELEEIQPNDLMLALRDSTNCGCNIQASMNRNPFPFTGRILITQPGQMQNLSLIGKCEGGCPEGPTYVSIIPPPLQQMVNGDAKPIELPIITFNKNKFDYNFPQTGVYRIQIQQICNGYVCAEDYEVEVRPTGKVEAMTSEWVEEIPEENQSFCLSGFYRVEGDSSWSPIAYQTLSMKEKSKVDFLVKSACYEDCEQIPQYQWKLVDTNGKEQVIGENTLQASYHFKRAGAYKIVVQETSPCANENQISPLQTTHIKVIK